MATFLTSMATETEAEPMSPNPYGYGLTLCLNDDQCEALGITTPLAGKATQAERLTKRIGEVGGERGRRIGVRPVKDQRCVGGRLGLRGRDRLPWVEQLQIHRRGNARVVKPRLTRPHRVLIAPVKR